MKRKQLKNIFWNNYRRLIPFAHKDYKDRVFQQVFKNKKDLLDLYNAINDTAYSNPDDLEITTIDNVIFMSIKNDMSFIISSTMNLYEHQSSINPNMPIRGLLYFSKLYDQYIKKESLNIYKSSLVELPVPQYIVFYNGSDSYPDRKTLLLSDSFKKHNQTTLPPALECRATVININAGHNQELMEKCKRLSDYSFFIQRIRTNLATGLSLEHSIDLAINYCSEHDILADVLSKNRGDIRMMLLTEFDQDLYEKDLKKDSFNEGRYSERNTIFQIMEAIQNGCDSVEKLKAAGFDESLSQKILEFRNPKH